MKRKNKVELRKKGILLLILSFFVLAGPSVAEENEDAVLEAAPSMKLIGYTQVRYTFSGQETDGFRIRRARVGLRGEIVKSISYHLQVDVVDSPILVDAAVEIGFIPYVQLILGQFKVPFSLENLTSSGELDTINRSQTVRNLCPGQDIGAKGRDIGLVVSGDYAWLKWTLGVFNGSGINTRDLNEKKDLVGRVVLNPLSFLAVGISHYQGLYSTFPLALPVDRDRTGVELYLVRGRASLKAEYIFGRDERTERSGAYVQGAVDIMPDKIQSIIKYDTYDRDLDVPDDRIEVITLGINWFFTKKTKFQVNYEHHKDDLRGTSENVILAQFQLGF